MSQLALESSAIGIDIGTTYCYVGVFKNGGVEVIANEQGNRAMPACVAFTAKERVVGEAAYNHQHLNNSNTVYHAKQLLGFNDFNAPEFQALLAASKFPFAVVEGANKKPAVEVEFGGATTQLTAEEIIAVLFRQMKQTASQYMGHAISKAVISVPPHYNEAQKAALMEAAKQAELEVLAMCDEPAAVAMAYGLDLPPAANAPSSSLTQNVVVVDCGGVSTNVTVLGVQNGVMEILGVDQDAQLGGEYIDDKLLHYFAKEFSRKNDGLDLMQSARAVTRLRHGCEKAKQVLSSSVNAPIELDALVEGVDLFSQLSRSKFEGLIVDFFKRLTAAIERALSAAGVERDEVASVLLAGGSSKIPKVRDTVRSFFGHKVRLLDGVKSVDEAAAHGCAIQASLLVTADAASSVSDLREVKLNALSVGVETAHGDFQVVIPRHTPLPTTKSIKASVASLAAGGLVRVLEGELRAAKANHLLGVLAMKDLHGSAHVKIDISMDRDANIEVYVTHSASRTREQLSLPAGAKQLSAAEVEAALAAGHKEHERLLEENKALAAQAEALEQRGATIRSEVAAGMASGALTAADQKIMQRAVDDVTSWLESITIGALVQAKKEDLERKGKGLELLFASVAKKIDAHNKSAADAAAQAAAEAKAKKAAAPAPAPPMMDGGDLD